MNPTALLSKNRHLVGNRFRANGNRPNSSFLRDTAIALAGGAVAVVLTRNFFESEKKITQKLSLDYDVHDPQFGRTMSQFLGPPLLKGNCVQVLENGDEIFPAMLEAIRSAKHSITFEN